MRSLTIVFALMAVIEMSASAAAMCGDGFLSDVLCRAGVSAKTLDQINKEIGKPIDHAISSSSQAEIVQMLFPVRRYSSPDDPAPSIYAAYGMVVFQAKPTDATRERLLMVCKSFIAHFPRDELSPPSVPISDRMATLWPVDKQDPKLDTDDCQFALDHYGLAASQLAMKDAMQQKATFDGAGPYLIGWSPSNSRGVPDRLVLIVDLTKDNTQAEIDQEFLFWKKKIVGNPSLWRNGFS